MSLMSFIEDTANQVEMVANLILLYAAWRWVRGYQWVKINISIGSFKVRRKDMDLPNLTAITSLTFFAGGWLPDNIRKELLQITCPDTAEVRHFEHQDTGTPPPEK